jgi:hypothetical protein
MTRDPLEKEPDDLPRKPENPFIRFRQFADSQISSLLQGVIGLPSAFSRSPPSNARWADFDDKLQRRDDDLNQQNSEALEAYRKAQADEERNTQRNPGPAENDTQQTAVKSWSFEWSWPPQKAENDEAPDNRVMDDTAARDLPLYSPTSKSLFQHLKYTHDSGDKWPEPRSLGFPAELISNRQWTSDAMRSLQYLIFNNLNNASSLRSDYSLLPYLLFSPYSPLKLSVPTLSATQQQQDDFPYCAAFEDLIRISHGRPMVPIVTVWTRIGLNPFHSFWSLDPVMVSLWSSFEWIKDMQDTGLLQEGFRYAEPTVPGLFSGVVEVASQMLEAARNPVSDLGKRSQDTESESEQDFYDRMDEMESLSNRKSVLWDSLISDIERQAERQGSEAPQVHDNETERKKSAPASILSLVESIRKELVDLDPEEARRAHKYILADLDKFSAAMQTPEGRQDFRAAWRQEKETKTVQDYQKAGTSSGSEKVVSSSTTTEHTVYEDGSVEKVVTSWKRFADGSEQTTSSSHIEDPSPERAPFDRSKLEEGRETSEQRKEKKGWFWN